MNDVKRYWYVPNEGFKILDPKWYDEESGYVAYEDYEKLMEIGATLSAGQCDGVVGDDYGRPFCKYKKERDMLRRRLGRAHTLLSRVMEEGDIDHVLGQTLVEKITAWLKDSKQ